MSTLRLLVFPATMDSAIPFVRTARSLGFEIVGASSVSTAPAIDELDDRVHLPFVSEAGFDHAFEAALSTHRITHVLAPHHVVWSHLNGLRRRLAAPFFLCSPHPFAGHWAAFSPSLEWAARQAPDAFPRSLAQSPRGLAPALTESQLAGLHRSFLHTPGETDEDKLAALYTISRLAPAGDVVEIGSLYGRSAQALSWLAGHYRIGATLCVDPWTVSEKSDQGPAARLVNEEAAHLDFEQIFRNFLATAASTPGTSYIRALSDDAIARYRESADSGSLHADGLDPVPVTGRIALLHIDGNHRYDCVRADIRNWTPHLADYGWLMLDDYVWSFGDGPRRAGDELLSGGDFDYAFVLSDTLFLRRAPAART
ncbi:MAG: class I SAM-dependent methyltransferase [Rhodocyclaceae bacterium]|nr:class I SAM-dependent methyltransferase [Rhodocyclaceae bacterium]